MVSEMKKYMIQSNGFSTQLKRLKGRMQFIFATHNANIQVLGDSEMLVVSEYVPDNEIKLE